MVSGVDLGCRAEYLSGAQFGGCCSILADWGSNTVGLGGPQEVEFTRLGDGVDLGKVEGRGMSKLTPTSLGEVAGWLGGGRCCCEGEP